MTCEAFLKHNLTSADDVYNTLFIDEATMLDETDGLQLVRYAKLVQLYGDPE